MRIETIVKQHSDHIGIPIILKGGDGGADGDGKDGDKTLNEAAAL